jgi:hypothetical protein
MPRASITKTPTPHTLRSGATAWDTYQEAMHGGWGTTIRLCLILIARWGLPISATVQLLCSFFPHAH